MPENHPPLSPWPPVKAPKGNFALGMAGLVFALGNSLVIQKWGSGWCNWTVFGLYTVAAILLLIVVFRVERFRESGGKILRQMTMHPVSIAILTLMVMAALWQSF